MQSSAKSAFDRLPPVVRLRLVQRVLERAVVVDGHHEARVLRLPTAPDGGEEQGQLLAHLPDATPSSQAQPGA